MVYGRFRERWYGEGQKLAVSLAVHNLLQKIRGEKNEQSVGDHVEPFTEMCSPGYKFPAIEPLHSHCGGDLCWQCGAGTPRSARGGTAT